MAVRKHIRDLTVRSGEYIGERFVLLKCTDENAPLPPMLPGQFAQLRVDGSKTTFLRRPVSINYVDTSDNEVWFLIQIVGDGSRALASLKSGDSLNAILPLGHGFTMPRGQSDSYLLVGGGVGVAPLLFLGDRIREMGGSPSFLLGARTSGMLLEKDMFRSLGNVYITTEDGTEGERGFVTHHSVWRERRFDMISVCGPSPMMKAVARKACDMDMPCEVSLENMMACGMGACLCCVEKTVRGNVCVCTEGPVFDVKELNW